MVEKNPKQQVLEKLTTDPWDGSEQHKIDLVIKRKYLDILVNDENPRVRTAAQKQISRMKEEAKGSVSYIRYIPF